MTDGFTRCKPGGEKRPWDALLGRLQCVHSSTNVLTSFGSSAYQANSPELREGCCDAMAQKDKKAKKILVVNDTQEILDLFRDILQEEGYEVELYSYAFNDLVEIKRIAPDLIILDYIIGGEDYGWQVLQKLKMDRATAAIPVIVCTGAVRQVREMEGHLKEKGVGIVLKPFDIDDLLHEVSECWQTLAADAARP